MSYDKMVRGVCMLGCKIPTEIDIAWTTGS